MYAVPNVSWFYTKARTLRSKHTSTVFNGVPSSAFPSSTGLGSSFDVDLAEEVGKALADECRAKGMCPSVLPQQHTH